MDEYSPARELSLALFAYVDALSGWRIVVEGLEREAGGPGRHAIDTGGERLLYRFARKVVDASYVGGAPEGEQTEKITLAARRYLLEVERLLNILEDLMHHLENVSGGEDDA